MNSIATNPLGTTQTNRFPAQLLYGWLPWQCILCPVCLCCMQVGTLVPVDPKAMFMSVVQLVLAPVIVGTTLNQYFPRVSVQRNLTLYLSVLGRQHSL